MMKRLYLRQKHAKDSVVQQKSRHRKGFVSDATKPKPRSVRWQPTTRLSIEIVLIAHLKR
jgi:hypothetical protein